MSQWPSADGAENRGASESPDAVVVAAKPQDPPGEPPKTVRCCILDGVSIPDLGGVSGRRGSGDGAGTPSLRRSSPVARRESARLASGSGTDSVRLKNHLEWKRQKEAEQAKRRDRERMEEAKRKEEKEREEKERRRKEKEREEKMREWQEQKAREKEERRREEMVLKALEQEIKGVTQTLDKEKLIHEWIRLKNKQKQLEAEKKAELLQKEEEARALRQSLAEISYRQWKERTKTRRIALPKNGYQIFGPKPVPVVKEDWNSDFASGSDSREAGVSARTAKSVASTTSIRAPFSRIDLSSLPVSSKSQLKITPSRTSINELPFRQLRIPPDVDASHKLKSVDSFVTRHDGHNPRQITGVGWEEESEFEPLRRFASSQSASAPRGNTPKSLAPPVAEVLPTKSKLDVYLRPALEAAKRAPREEEEDTLKNYLRGLGEANSKLIIDLTEKLSSSRFQETADGAASDVDSSCRRSRSYDKPVRKVRVGAECHPSKSMSKTLTAAAEIEKGKKDVGEVKKKRKSLGRRDVGEEKPAAQKTEAEGKVRRKPSRKCVKSVAEQVAGPLADSPYCARRTRARSKANRSRKED